MNNKKQQEKRKASVPKEKTRYEKYLESPAWIAIAKSTRAQAQYKCQLCGVRDRPLHVHHNTYENIYNEAKHPEDLVVLCEDCHKRTHDYFKTKKK